VTTDNKFDLILSGVWEEVKNLEIGVLYKTIFILAPDNAIDICDVFKIREYHCLDDDIQALDRIKIFQDVLDTFDPWKARLHFNIHKTLTKMIGKLIDNNDLIIKIIIGIGLIAIALYLLNPSRKQPTSRSQSQQSPATEIPKGDAILCLIIPTNQIDSTLQNILFPEVELTIEETKILIEKSDYFISCEERKLDDYTGGLNLSTATINYAEEGEMYIKILLAKGEDTIDREIKRSLSRNLPDSAIVQGVYLLNDLSNIAQFHRA
jgi:hypothetical protein